MTFQWEVRDGYAGKSRPQFTDIDDQELLECEDIDEAVRLVEDAIQDDYNTNIMPEWDENEVRELVKELFKNKTE